jgi:hypothetical protein
MNSPTTSPADAPDAFRPPRPRSWEPPAEATTTAGVTGPPTRPGGPSGTARPKRCTVDRCTPTCTAAASVTSAPANTARTHPTTARQQTKQPVPIPASRRSGRPTETSTPRCRIPCCAVPKLPCHHDSPAPPVYPALGRRSRGQIRPSHWAQAKLTQPGAGSWRVGECWRRAGCAAEVAAGWGWRSLRDAGH